MVVCLLALAEGRTRELRVSRRRSLAGDGVTTGQLGILPTDANDRSTLCCPKIAAAPIMLAAGRDPLI
jgi:hypothetical protein